MHLHGHRGVETRHSNSGGTAVDIITIIKETINRNLCTAAY